MMEEAQVSKTVRGDFSWVGVLVGVGLAGMRENIFAGMLAAWISAYS